jgi:hypothetical protein
MQESSPQDAVENYVKKYFENMAWLKYIGTFRMPNESCIFY